jgi:hypothetical protein
MREHGRFLRPYLVTEDIGIVVILLDRFFAEHDNVLRGKGPHMGYEGCWSFIRKMTGRGVQGALRVRV